MHVLFMFRSMSAIYLSEEKRKKYLTFSVPSK